MLIDESGIRFFRRSEDACYSVQSAGVGYPPAAIFAVPERAPKFLMTRFTTHQTLHRSRFPQTASSTFPKFESYRSVTTTNNNRHSGARVTREARDKRTRNP
jgi:hypothetical protein